jgi:ATP-dependent Clp protease adaptor protein ClpS
MTTPTHHLSSERRLGLRPHAADDDRKRRNEPNGPGTAVITKTKPQTKKPNLYRVLLLNDDYTPMEFVVHVLERFFNKDREAATRIMLHVHHHGIGECGIYTYEVAETKVTQVMDFARKHQEFRSRYQVAKPSHDAIKSRCDDDETKCDDGMECRGAMNR